MFRDLGVAIPVVLTVAFSISCTRYRAESKYLSPGVEVVAYYRCQRPDCTLVEPSVSRMEIMVDGERVWRSEAAGGQVSNVYLMCNRLFVRISSERSRALFVLT